MEYNKKFWDEYERLVDSLEEEGLTTSDAQGVADLIMKEKMRNLNEKN